MNTSKIYSFSSGQPEYLNAEADKGSVKATAYVMIVDFAGVTRRRRIGTRCEYNVSRETAKSMANDIRGNNPGLQMRVQYTEEM